MITETFRGAPFGRPGTTGPQTDRPRFYLSRLRLNSGGYDTSGCYWGLGPPLYQYQTEDGSSSGTCRARTRDGAKQKVCERFPTARFFR